nr:MAG TPA: hypothetical protein [Caudoviricetes sp.]
MGHYDAPAHYNIIINHRSGLTGYSSFAASRSDHFGVN